MFSIIVCDRVSPLHYPWKGIYVCLLFARRYWTRVRNVCRSASVLLLTVGLVVAAAWASVCSHYVQVQVVRIESKKTQTASHFSFNLRIIWWSIPLCAIPSECIDEKRLSREQTKFFLCAFPFVINLCLWVGAGPTLITDILCFFFETCGKWWKNAKLSSSHTNTIHMNQFLK